MTIKMLSFHNIFVSFNVGNTHPLNRFPMAFEFESPRSFTDFIRQEDSMLSLLVWSFANGFSAKRMKIWARIETDDKFWEFDIQLKNVREWKKYLEMDGEEIGALLEAHERDGKIESIIG